MHRELLDSARRSIRPVSGAATQSDLKRAVSTAYYALFHFIAQDCADALTGGGAKQLSRAAAQIYRSLDHRDIASACSKAQQLRFGFPKAIMELARVFDETLKARHRADYDPSSMFVLPQVESKLSDVETAIAAYAAADRDDRRAFAVLVVIKSPAKGRTGS